MKFDARTAEPLGPALVLDAQGRDIGWPVAGDTEAGELLVQIRENGTVVANYDTGTLVMERRRYEAPLTIEPYGTVPGKYYGVPRADHVEPPYELLERIE